MLGEEEARVGDCCVPRRRNGAKESMVWVRKTKETKLSDLVG